MKAVLVRSGMNHPADFQQSLATILRQEDVDDLRKYQLALRETLSQVDGLCRRHGISYWLDGGTLLGAVRHGGFIPWDDDVDIAMPRADYQRFLAVAAPELPEGLEMETEARHLGLYHAWARVLHFGAFTWTSPTYPGKCAGFYLDIFPIDRATEGAQLSWVACKLNHWFFRFRRCPSLTWKHRLANALSMMAARLWRAYCRLLDVQGRGTHVYYGADTPFFTQGLGLPLDAIYPLKELEFEGLRFLVPADAARYLRSLYGDYWRLPPLEQRVGHNTNLRLIDL